MRRCSTSLASNSSSYLDDLPRRIRQPLLCMRRGRERRLSRHRQYPTLSSALQDHKHCCPERIHSTSWTVTEIAESTTRPLRLQQRRKPATLALRMRPQFATSNNPASSPARRFVGIHITPPIGIEYDLLATDSGSVPRADGGAATVVPGRLGALAVDTGCGGFPRTGQRREHAAGLLPTGRPPEC